ncbi:MAG: hypothetical protein R3250_11515, partial [Melioribacteraceae bacterium]|nr:hypothetical protein [Melioribacteraceae bacterium]
MIKLSPSQKVTIYTDVIILVICIFGVFNFVNKSDLPFRIENREDLSVVQVKDTTHSSFNKNDLVKSIDGKELNTKEEIETFLDGVPVNTNLSALVLRDNTSLKIEFLTTNYYS